MSISSDPKSIPEKATVGFSWREFGYIAAEQYKRLNSFQFDDGIGARTDMEKAYGMWRYTTLQEPSIVGKAFVAGWMAYMQEHGHSKER